MRLCEITAIYKPAMKNCNRPKVTSAFDAYSLKDYIYEDGTLEYKEYAYILCLNNANRVLGSCLVGSGGLASTFVDVKIVFQHLLLANATSFILIHNHPSGSLKPSPQDIRLTENVRKASEIMGFNFVDHIIFTADSFFSFRDDGRL